MKVFDMRRGRLPAAVCTLCLMLAATTAQAEDRTGVVTHLMLDDTNYMALRVKLKNISSFCSGGAGNQHIAYLAGNAPHYHAVLRALMAAQLAKKAVTIRSTKSGAYCRITGVILEDQ